MSAVTSRNDPRFSRLWFGIRLHNDYVHHRALLYQRASGTAFLNLLLLLTAFFASLTGNGSADAKVHQVSGVAVVQAAKTVEAATQSARAVLPTQAEPVGLLIEAKPLPLDESAALASYYLPFERRLE